MKRKKNEQSDTVLWARQYSKRLITALLVGWGIGAVIGAVYEYIRLIVSPMTAGMDAFYIYLAVPLTCGIPSYIVPNMFLNKAKIEKHYIPDYDQTVLNGEYDGEEGIGTTKNEVTDDIGLHTDNEALPGE